MSLPSITGDSYIHEFEEASLTSPETLPTKVWTWYAHPGVSGWAYSLHWVALYIERTAHWSYRVSQYLGAGKASSFDDHLAWHTVTSKPVQHHYTSILGIEYSLIPLPLQGIAVLTVTIAL